MPSLLEVIGYLFGGLITLVLIVAIGIHFLVSDMDEDGNVQEKP